MVDMEYNLYDIFEKISVRTGMYIGEQNLSNLRSYIGGYEIAMYSVKAQNNTAPDFSDFHNWVAKKYGFYESTAGWHNMILAVEMGLPVKGINWESYSKEASEAQHKQSLVRFFRLVQEFRNA
ncbi:MAG: hypothetical protein KBT75_12050 [Oleispira antarctica]|uniref:Uncharacterized protein n=1 Tax=Oleispira antarctica RB-8 TaxID=698738 RepID=R4YRY9_OLEAN|nr:hypothetical protein [Oleispira antarctica]MBQ0792235.1 hypothetical protein [Oleispira antarctica]CCK74879.1 conserved hypothetical protein [Oleispira antarctica RB-8]